MAPRTGGESPSGKASLFGSDMRRFESCLPCLKRVETRALAIARARAFEVDGRRSESQQLQQSCGLRAAVTSSTLPIGAVCGAPVTVSGLVSTS